MRGGAVIMVGRVVVGDDKVPGEAVVNLAVDELIGVEWGVKWWSKGVCGVKRDVT